TVILAEQHFHNLIDMGWDDVQLYTAGCEDRGTAITVGTHAILGDEQLLASAVFVTVDEFQRTGVSQRAIIQKSHPHFLLASATPLPRSMMISVLGGLSVSEIRQQPIQRGNVIVRWVLPQKRDGVYSIVERELNKGHQAFIIYPRIGDEEQEQSAVKGLREWSQRYDENDSEFDASDVALLTGKTSPEDKLDIFRQFKEGHIRILISTIIVEVGIDCKNATVAVVVGADKFGLAQLWQIRGRVCRSEDTSFLLLLAETSNETSIARLDTIERAKTGFEIAEHDLRLRGAGEVFSTRQTGLPDLRWCSLVDDYDLMIEAKETVQAGSVGSGVREMMELKYGKSLELGGVV
ncbi:hypothetical protein LCGC14_3046410, partial [marine sediment metagenome]